MDIKLLFKLTLLQNIIGCRNFGVHMCICLRDIAKKREGALGAEYFCRLLYVSDFSIFENFDFFYNIKHFFLPIFYPLSQIVKKTKYILIGNDC